jgi:RHS repeat-associated protein
MAIDDGTYLESCTGGANPICVLTKTSNTPDGIVDYYKADVITAVDYYPFGMTMPGRKFTLGEYRYGFNGKENDNDAGEGIQDYGMRVYDGRLGRFLSVDPLQKQYPELTPYQFASNTPIQAIDLDGGEAYYYTISWNEKTGKVSITFDKTETSWLDPFVPNHIVVNFNNKGYQYYGDLTNNQIKNGELASTLASIATNPTAAQGKIDRNTERAAADKVASAEETKNIFAMGFAVGVLGSKSSKPAAAKSTPEAKTNNQATAANGGNTQAAKSNTTTMYRGVNENNVGYNEALKGNATPNGGSATPLQHNTTSTLNSPFTSWTPNPEVALNFALRPAGAGVVLTAQIPNSKIVVSPNTKQVQLIQNPSVVVSESEVLVKGKVTNASVKKVTAPKK